MGGGGGGGSGLFRRPPEQIAKEVRESLDKLVSEGFQVELGSLLSSQLSTHNTRDASLTNDRLSEIKGHLGEVLEGSVDHLYGGSVAKRTFVSGLSDVDSLLIINDTSLADKSPSDALDRLVGILSGNVPDATEVTRGRMAVTVEYADGMEIQLLPAIRRENGLRIPSSRTEAWSDVNPEGFQRALTRANAACGEKLVPVIKLAKAINATLPDALRLSGYHMESLGIAAFRGYEGPFTTAEMLPSYFERAAKLILSPITDRTGQSVHVDEYLGTAESPDRVARGHLLDRVARRMRNATTSQSIDQWKAILGIDR
jgi:hypothetical protein